VALEPPQLTNEKYLRKAPSDEFCDLELRSLHILYDWPVDSRALSDLWLEGQLLRAITFNAIPALLLSAICAVRSVLQNIRQAVAQTRPDRIDGRCHIILGAEASER